MGDIVLWVTRWERVGDGSVWLTRLKRTEVAGDRLWRVG